MAFTKINGPRTYVKANGHNVGDVILKNGTFIGQETDKFDKPSHLFKMPDGNITVVNSSGHLNWLVSKYLTPGTRCNIIYSGKNLLNSGKFAGKEAHSFELEVDTDTMGAMDAMPKAPAPVKTQVSAPAYSADDITL